MCLHVQRFGQTYKLTNAVHKFLCMPEEITENSIKALWPTFIKFMVIFMGENANNTSKATSLVGGFTVVVIVFEIIVLLPFCCKFV